MAGKTKKVQHDMADVSRAFKALSNETRLAVFESIRLGCGQATAAKGEHPTVCAVASNFASSLSTISHHIKELRNAGLIHCERRGQTIL